MAVATIGAGFAAALAILKRTSMEKLPRNACWLGPAFLAAFVLITGCGSSVDGTAGMGGSAGAGGTGSTGGTDGGVTCESAQDCDDGNQCTEDTCEPIAAMCAHTPVGDGTDCDFGGSTGVCTAGTCGVSDNEVMAIETNGGGVMSSEQYRMSVSIGGPVGRGTASSANHQIEFHLPSSQ
jgi:hypothetical protein